MKGQKEIQFYASNKRQHELMLLCAVPVTLTGLETEYLDHYGIGTT